MKVYPLHCGVSLYPPYLHIAYRKEKNIVVILLGHTNQLFAPAVNVNISYNDALSTYLSCDLLYV